MSEHDVRYHLKRALTAVADAEQNRVSEILSDSKTRITQGVNKMKPVITLILALKEEVGDVEGLEISPAEHGHMALVNARTSVSTNHLSISTNYECSAFEVKESSAFLIDGSRHESKREFAAAEDVMTQVLRVVGKHLGAQRAHQAHRNSSPETPSN